MVFIHATSSLVTPPRRVRHALMKNIFSFVLVLVLALALVASTAVAEDVPSVTGSMIMTALEEVSAGVREDVTEIMDELGMDAETTHFQRFASRETGDVMKKSFAMIQCVSVPRHGIHRRYLLCASPRALRAGSCRAFQGFH
jgi:hypothetical protein